MKSKKLAIAGVITALILLMGFTPLGYIPLGAVKVTTLMIPVSIGAILLGPAYGAFFGFLFGATSFTQCFLGDVFGAALISQSVLYTLLCTIVPRTLMGLCTGFIFRALSKMKSKTIPVIISSVCSAVLNTVFFMAFFLLFFRNASLDAIGMNLGALSIWQILLAIVGINGIVEIAVCALISGALSRVLIIWLKK